MKTLLYALLLPLFALHLYAQTPVSPPSQPPLEKLPADAPAKPDKPAPTKAPPATKPAGDADPTPPRLDPPKPTPRVEPSPLRASAVRTAYETYFRQPDGGVLTNTQHGSGTVVAVEPNRLLVLSCDHTVRDEAGYRGGRVFVAAADGKRRPAKVLHYDTAADMSVLEVPGEPPAGVRAAAVASEESYQPGLAVVKAGFPGAGELHLGRGVVRDVTSHNTNDPSVVHTIATATSRSGDSGGGLYRESDGALVGVVWGGRPDGLRAGRLKHMHALLAKVGVRAEGKRTVAVSDAPASFDSVPAVDKLPMPAAEAGAKPATLTVRGGTREVLDLTRSLKPGKTYRVTVEEVGEK